MDKAPQPVYLSKGDEDPLDLFAAEELPVGDTTADTGADAELHAGEPSYEPAAVYAPPDEPYADSRVGDAPAYEDSPRMTYAEPSPTYAEPPRALNHPPLSAPAPRPRAYPSAVPAEPTPTVVPAWFQRNGLSIAAVVVACLGTAAILIGMRHGADTEIDGWNPRLDTQPPASAPASTSNSSPTPAPVSRATETDQAGLGGNADEPVATPTGTGLAAVPPASPVRETIPPARDLVAEAAARETLAREAAARDAAARDAAREAALRNAPPLVPAPTAPRTGTQASNTTPAPPLNTPPPAVSSGPAVTPALPSSQASNTAASTAPPAVQPQPSETPSPSANTPAAPAETALAANPNPSIVSSVAREPVAPPALPTPRERRDDVQRKVNQYSAAYNALDVNAVKSAWPTADAQRLGEYFKGQERVEYRLQPCEINLQAGGRATATCLGSIRSMSKSDRREVSRQQTWQFSLRETDRGWTIDNVVAK